MQEFEALSRLLESMPGVGTYVWRVVDDELNWSPSLMKIYGLTRQPDRENGFISLIHPEDRVRVEAETACFLGSGDSYMHDFRIVRPDGEVRFIHDRGVIERNAAGSVITLRGINVDMTGDSDRHADPSVVHFRTLADNISQLAWIADGTGWIYWYNKRWLEFTGTTISEMAGWGWRKVHHPEHVDRVVERISQSFAAGTPWEDTFPLRGADGAYRWFLSRAQPVHNGAGKVIYWFGTNTDVTEQRKAEESLRQEQQRRQLLIDELVHRVKNTITLVQAVARRTLSADNLTAASVGDFTSRLTALAGAHDVLTRETWLDVPLMEVLSRAVHGCGVPPARFAISGPPVMLPARAATTVSMTIHELTTNAVKYGALSMPEGAVTLSWRRPDDDTDRLLIEWRERDGPPVKPPRHEGFGTRMIKRALVAELGGTVELNFATEGLECIIDVRVERNQAATT